jgi:hypothetical protein
LAIDRHFEFLAAGVAAELQILLHAGDVALESRHVAFVHSYPVPTRVLRLLMFCAQPRQPHRTSESTFAFSITSGLPDAIALTSA